MTLCNYPASENFSFLNDISVGLEEIAQYKIAIFFYFYE